MDKNEETRVNDSTVSYLIKMKMKTMTLQRRSPKRCTFTNKLNDILIMVINNLVKIPKGQAKQGIKYLPN